MWQMYENETSFKMLSDRKNEKFKLNYKVMNNKLIIDFEPDRFPKIFCYFLFIQQVYHLTK